MAWCMPSFCNVASCMTNKGLRCCLSLMQWNAEAGRLCKFAPVMTSLTSPDAALATMLVKHMQLRGLWCCKGGSRLFKSSLKVSMRQECFHVGVCEANWLRSCDWKFRGCYGKSRGWYGAKLGATMGQSGACDGGISWLLWGIRGWCHT